MAKVNKSDLVVFQALQKNSGRELTLRQIAQITGESPLEVSRSLGKLFGAEPFGFIFEYESWSANKKVRYPVF